MKACGGSGRRWARAALGLLVLACPAALSHAAGNVNLTDGWLLGPSATSALLGETSVQGSAAWLTLGHSRLYGLPELPVAAVTVGARADRWWGAPSLELRWQALGQGLYREDERRVWLQWGRQWSLGLLLRSLHVETGGENHVPVRHDSFWRAEVTVQAGWRFRSDSAVTWQLLVPIAEQSVTQLRRGWRRLFGIQAWQGAVGAAAVVNLRADASPTLGLEWVLAWGGAACGARIEPSVGVLGPVLAWRRGTLLVRTSHLVHPQLGITHRIQIGFGQAGGPRW